MVSEEIDGILRKCKDALQALYGARFAGLVLYGSIARGDYDAESDIDLLVLLHGEVRSISEIEPIDEALAPVQWDCDRLISAHAVAVDDYRDGRWSFLRIAAREGAPI